MYLMLKEFNTIAKFYNFLKNIFETILINRTLYQEDGLNLYSFLFYHLLSNSLQHSIFDKFLAYWHYA